MYLLHLDADHVPEPGQVLAGGHEGILVAGDVLEYLQFIRHFQPAGSQYFKAADINCPTTDLFVDANIKPILQIFFAKKTSKSHVKHRSVMGKR